MTAGFALFDTALGRCGLAWSASGLTAVSFPEGADAATRARLAARAGAQERPPPPWVEDAIAHISALIAGQAADLDDIPLDLTGVPAFDRDVYALCRAIPAGETKTYGDLAKALGDPGAARAIGAALGRNPHPIVTPCHRVLAAGGRTGGFSAPGGVRTKLRLLEIERAAFGPRDLFS